MLSTAFDGDTNLDTFKIALVYAIHNVSAEKHLDVDKDLDVSDISVFERKAGVCVRLLCLFLSLFFLLSFIAFFLFLPFFGDAGATFMSVCLLVDFSLFQGGVGEAIFGLLTRSSSFLS